MDTTVIIKQAEQHCETHGVRFTNKRKQVLLSLIGSGKALSAYGLIDICEQEFGEKIPAMSMYRILECLEKIDLVHKLNLANKYVACSDIGCSHQNGAPQLLICEECDQVKELHINQLTADELKNNVTNAGFTLVKQHLEMNCICNNCLTVMAQSTNKSVIE